MQDKQNDPKKINVLYQAFCYLIWGIGTAPIVAWPVAAIFSLIGVGSIVMGIGDGAGNPIDAPFSTIVAAFSFQLAVFLYPIPCLFALFGLLGRLSFIKRNCIAPFLFSCIPLFYDLILLLLAYFWASMEQ